MATEFKTNLTSFVRTSPRTASGGKGDIVSIDLDDVPMIGIETTPLRGLSTYFGTTDPPAALREQIRIAEEKGKVLYEVRLHVVYEAAKLAPTPTVQDIQSTGLLNLPRANKEAIEWLSNLIRDEIESIDDHRIADWRLPKIVSTYPHLLDALVSQRELSHIALVIWQTNLLGVQAAKIATVYHPDCVREVHTINSDHVRAILPARLYDSPSNQAGLIISRGPRGR
ncbi:MAG: hypothetical protein ABIW82_17080 [Dokdonella sp.]